MMHHSVVVQERILRLQGSSASGWPLTIRILGVPVDNVRVVLRWMYTYDLELLPTTALSLVDVYNTAKALQMKGNDAYYVCVHP